MWRPCCKTYRRFLHKKERGLPAFRWQTSWRRWRDSNSRAGFEPTYRISSADPSTAWVHLQIYVISLVPTRRPIQPVEIGKNNRIEQTPIHNLNLPANPHGYWLFGSLDFQSGNMISSLVRTWYFRVCGGRWRQFWKRRKPLRCNGFRTRRPVLTSSISEKIRVRIEMRNAPKRSIFLRAGKKTCKKKTLVRYGFADRPPD